MKTSVRKRIFTMTFALLMVVSLAYTSLPMEALATDINSENQTEETVQTPEVGEDPGDGAVENAVDAIEPIMPAITVDGIDFNVSIAKSLDGVRPADGVFAGSDSIDLANVTRYDMFYAYIKIDYANHSGADLTGTSITMQLPKLGEAGYYEAITQSGAPSNWIAYPNTLTGDGNTNFPAVNMSTNATSRLMTWAGTTIADGSTGTIYIKIPMRDPYTKFGLINYTPTLNYTKGGTASTIEESSQFDIAGQNDQPSFSLSKETDLGFVPSELDADQYFYVKYKMTTSYSQYYALPKRAYEYDRFLTSAYIDVTIPAGAEIVSLPANTTVTGNVIRTAANFANGGYTVLRYLKADYLDPNQEVSIPGIFYGRFVSNSVAQNVVGSENTFTHPIGTGSVIPVAALGNISTPIRNLPISEDALKVGSVPFTSGGVVISRSNDTVAGDELTYEFNGLEYIKNGSPLPTDYGINMILITGAIWTGNLDSNNPMSASITFYFDDGSSEVVKTLTEAQIVATNGGTIYQGNVPGVVYAYQPPAGKIAKRVVTTFSNIPQGFRVSPYINGYLTGYPAGGVDSVRFNRVTNLYGIDTGSGRPLAIGSGDTSFNVAIAKNTSFQPTFTMERTSTGTVNPGQTDTLKLQSFFQIKQPKVL